MIFERSLAQRQTATCVVVETAVSRFQ